MFFIYYNYCRLFENIILPQRPLQITAENLQQRTDIRIGGKASGKPTGKTSGETGLKQIRLRQYRKERQR